MCDLHPLSWHPWLIFSGDDDEDITLSDTHTPSIPPTIGSLTRARARQLNHEVSSFLSVPLYFDEDGMLLNNCDVLLLRNTGEEQQGRPSQGGGPIKFESVSESRTSLH